MAATERLSPPLSLAALGLKPTNNLDDAVRALLRSHEEIRDLPPHAGGSPEADTAEAATQLRQRHGARQAGTCSVDAPLPERDQLLVLVCREAQQDDILGGTFAVQSGHQRLADLGVRSDAQRLCLAKKCRQRKTGRRSFLRMIRSCAKGASRCCLCCCCRRSRCCAGCRQRLWKKLSPARQEWIQSHVQMLGFYVVCVRWGVRWLWEDRHMLLQELRAIIVYDLWAANDFPPLKSDQVSSELRPFCYALAAGLLYVIYGFAAYLMWAPGPAMDMIL